MLLNNECHGKMKRQVSMKSNNDETIAEIYKMLELNEKQLTKRTVKIYANLLLLILTPRYTIVSISILCSMVLSGIIRPLTRINEHNMGCILGKKR